MGKFSAGQKKSYLGSDELTRGTKPAVVTSPDDIHGLYNY